jgi:hypothetical protein
MAHVLFADQDASSAACFIDGMEPCADAGRQSIIQTSRRLALLALTVMAPAPPLTMTGTGAMTVSLTPALSRGERGTWSACGAIVTVTQPDAICLEMFSMLYVRLTFCPF